MDGSNGGIIPEKERLNDAVNIDIGPRNDVEEFNCLNYPYFQASFPLTKQSL